MRKLFIGFFIVLVFIFTAPDAVLAADRITEQDHPAMTERKGDSSTLPALNFNIEPSSTYFFSSRCSINKKSNTSIEGKVTTYATQIVDEIGYVLYFQKFDGNKWITIETNTNSYNNRSYLNLKHLKSVARNQSYRVYVKHYIIHNNKTYSQITISDSIYLN